uniref:Uncharacterized protein n=1 Tax=Chromera velia CCMP2878 TaxID=1169474 RepID=A0A0G4FJK1_9ALVE|eukprot:Cvel_3402.t1-p1 / transcript=Cvel_3402.t1 / gene=Cvel_3402 / organism=Chromera_velia_CCMP2878 / gene_product=hypothetical protein / transcript_product=hypothetical protein / location=Cvel_scaffold137:11860-12681(-) / protein_length=274 / sequence_SO=supercontig / SO=protein_coding / is_pseudo=false
MEGEYDGNPDRGVSDLKAFQRGFLSRIRGACYPPKDGKPRENTQFALVLRGRGVDRVTRTCTVEEREPTSLERREWDYLEDLRANAIHQVMQDMTIRPHLPVRELLSPQRVYVEEDITPPASSFDQQRGRDRRGYRVEYLKEQESSTLWFGVDSACFYNLITHALFQAADAVGAIVWKWKLDPPISIKGYKDSRGDADLCVGMTSGYWDIRGNGRNAVVPCVVTPPDQNICGDLPGLFTNVLGGAMWITEHPAIRQSLIQAEAETRALTGHQGA